jgi:hypothetical protein
MVSYRYAKVPAQGERIAYSGGALRAPPNDLARQTGGATAVSTSALGDQIIRSMPA